MATPCVVNLSTLIPDCFALKSVGGVRDFGYYCRRIDITGVTRATDGTVTAVTVATGKLKKYQTGKFQDSGAVALLASDIGKTRFGQTYTQRIYARSQEDTNAITALALAEDVVIFSPNNDNQVKIFGLELGLKVTALAWNTGVKLEDDNTALLTFTGGESELPPLFSTTTPVTTPTAATNATAFLADVAYLDDLVGA